MQRNLVMIIALLTALAFTANTADAHKHHRDRRLGTVSLGVGAAWTGGAFAFPNASVGAAIGVTTFGCMVTSPMVATAVLHRPLTYREADVLMGSCIIPFIGGWLVNRAYDSGMLWAPDEKPAQHRRWHRK